MSGFPYPGVIVEPQGQSTVVSITDKNGNVVTGYADAYAITPISFPDTISSRTTFYLPGEGPWTVSAKVSGIELAGSSLTLEGSEIATVTLAAPLPPQSGAFANLSLTGTYAARPAANTVAAGTIYYATDVAEASRSDGSTWTLISHGGSELGYAQSTSNVSVGGGSGITGVTVTVTGGDSPLLVETAFLFAPTTPSATTDIVWQLDQGATELGEWHGTCSGTFVYVNFKARVAALAGTSATFKPVSSNGATGTVYGSTTYPAWIRVSTL